MGDRRFMDRLDTYVAGIFTSCLASIGGVGGWLLNSDLAGQLIMAVVVGLMGGVTSLAGIYIKHKLDLKKELVLKALERGLVTIEEVKKLL
jgi:hypothetical protein